MILEKQVIPMMVSGKWIDVDKYCGSPPVVTHQSPRPRSGHASTQLPTVPHAQILIFGGADHETFYDDVYLLECRRPTGEIVSHCPRWTRIELLSSDDDDRLDDTEEEEEEPVLPLGCGRCHHSMHFIQSSTSNSTSSKWMTSLVFGNVLISRQDTARAFAMSTMRVEVLDVDPALGQGRWRPAFVQELQQRAAAANDDPHPQARDGHSSVKWRDHVYVFGGKNASGSEYFNDLWRFNCVTWTWTRIRGSGVGPSARAFAELTLAQDKFFLYGGYNGKIQFGEVICGAGAESSHQAGLAVFDPAMGRWDVIQTHGLPKPSPRINHSWTSVGDHLVLFGGRHKGKRKNDIFCFHVETQSWIQPQKVIGEPPVGRNAHIASALIMTTTTVPSSVSSTASNSNHRLVIFGGYQGQHRWLGDIGILELKSMTMMSCDDSETLDVHDIHDENKNDLKEAPQVSSPVSSSLRLQQFRNPKNLKSFVVVKCSPETTSPFQNLATITKTSSSNKMPSSSSSSKRRRIEETPSQVVKSNQASSSIHINQRGVAAQLEFYGSPLRPSQEMPFREVDPTNSPTAKDWTLQSKLSTIDPLEREKNRIQSKSPGSTDDRVMAHQKLDQMQQWFVQTFQALRQEMKEKDRCYHIVEKEKVVMEIKLDQAQEQIKQLKIQVIEATQGRDDAIYQMNELSKNIRQVLDHTSSTTSVKQNSRN